MTETPQEPMAPADPNLPLPGETEEQRVQRVEEDRRRREDAGEEGERYDGGEIPEGDAPAESADAPAEGEVPAE